MNRKRFKPEEIVNKLREADVLTGNPSQACSICSKPIVAGKHWSDDQIA